MAKKKSKKNSQIDSLITLLSVLLGIVAIIMLFVPSIAVVDSDTTYKGLDVVFGLKENKPLVGEVVYFEFSFMNLLTYVLVAVGVLFTILAYLGKGSKFATLIATVAFIVSAVFFFLQIAYCIPGKGIEDLVSGIGSLFGEDASVKDSLELGTGAIVGGICSALAGVASGYKLLTK